MKKIFLIIFSFCALSIFAQSPTVIGNPSNYTVIDENVELIFDVTGVVDKNGNSLEGKDLYIWTFSNVRSSKANGSWTSIKPGSQLEKLSDTQYRYKFPVFDGTTTYNTLAELYGAEASPGAITSIGFLLRDHSPTFQTADFSLPFSPFKFDPAEVRTFPSTATTVDVITFRFNQSFAPLSNPAMTGARNISVHVEPKNSVADAIEIPTVFDGRYYQAAIIPAKSFETLNEAGSLVEVKYYFFDSDNPTIKSAERSITLKKPAN